MNIVTRSILVTLFGILSIVGFEYLLASFNIYRPGSFIADGFPFLILVGTILYLIYAFLIEKQQVQYLDITDNISSDENDISILRLAGYGFLIGLSIAISISLWRYYQYGELHPHLLDLELENMLRKIQSEDMSKKDIRIGKEAWVASPPIKKLAFVRFIFSSILSLLISLLGSFMLKKVVTT